MPPGLVIFDCDGVLVDSQVILDRVLSEALEWHGLDLSMDETSKQFKGLSNEDVVAKAEVMLGRALPDGFIDFLLEREVGSLLGELKAVSGVSEAIGIIRAAGIPVCVASSGDVPRIRFNLGHTVLLHHFGEDLFSAADVPRGKPYPDVFLHSATQMGVIPHRCVVIEDSVAGTQAGVAAGMSVLAYSERGDAEELRQAGGQVFTSMQELPGLLGI